MQKNILFLLKMIILKENKINKKKTNIKILKEKKLLSIKSSKKPSKRNLSRNYKQIHSKISFLKNENSEENEKQNQDFDIE